jgi:UDP-N-acetylglucosamine diphosphorylase / glucose-1-phosphate thymidylyltransferase / UDP-N-acetylgalactosamine diphosphorylase / glucosamine-1-phosphate N-acetyltransferase / galactosamine-1-phosphate N-acetyltransferase
VKAKELFDFPKSLPFCNFFLPDLPPWVWVSQIKNALADFNFCQTKKVAEIQDGVHISGQVFIDPTVKLPPYCVITGPAYIGQETEIRPGAYIRGNVIVGRGCVLGNSCEYKNCLLMDDVQTAHFNYVGDSILGNKTHLGAGAILANLKFKADKVVAKTPESICPTGLKKLGAMLGEKAQVGCNAVLSPGTILGKGSIVMPSVPFSGGYLPEKQIAYPHKH